MQRIRIADFILSLSQLFFTLNYTIAQNLPLKHFECAFLAQDLYPAGLNSVDWFPDDLEVQGVTNDGANWFFTVVNQGSSVIPGSPTEGFLWRIPKEVPLAGDVSSYPGVKMVKATDIPELDDSMHYHWGDPDHVRYGGVDYILVPIYSIVACFRADNLEYLNYAKFDSNVAGGWCAVGTDLGLYSSANNPSSVVRYEVDWNKLVNTHEHDVLSNPQSFTLIQSDGSPLYMTDMQGGEFSPSGEMLYLASGRGACLEWLGLPGAEWTPQDGIHAIRTDDWREINRSVKSSPSADNYFSYNYDPTCIICTILGIPVGGGTDTPEGLTFWDLEDGSAPGIRGSLHVLHDRYLTGGTACDDELYLHHYSTKVFVDVNTTGGPGLLGRSDHPFETFPDAMNYYPIWNGAHVVLRSGNYPIPTGGITLNKRLLISSEGGPAAIGKQ